MLPGIKDHGKGFARGHWRILAFALAVQSFFTYALITVPIVPEIPIGADGQPEMPPGWRIQLLMAEWWIEFPVHLLSSLFGIDPRGALGLVMNFVLGAAMLTWLLLIGNKLVRRCANLVSSL